MCCALCALSRTHVTYLYTTNRERPRPHLKQVSAAAAAATTAGVCACVWVSESMVHARLKRYPANGNNKNKHVKLFARVKWFGVSSRQRRQWRRSSPSSATKRPAENKNKNEYYDKLHEICLRVHWYRRGLMWEWRHLADTSVVTITLQSDDRTAHTLNEQ